MTSVHANTGVPRVLVWGGRGFIGRHLVAELLARGYAVDVLRRGDAPGPALPWSSQVTSHELKGDDMRAAFKRALANARVVFNLAGSSGAVESNRRPIASLEANCRLQLDFLQACEESQRFPHVVFASSRLVYAPKGSEAVSEVDALGPRSMYAAHKVCVEHYHDIYARARAITYTIARISNPFGPDPYADQKTYGFINALIDRAQRGLGLQLFGRGSQLRDYVYIRDLVDGLIRCAERPESKNQIFNISRGVSVSMQEAALLIRDRVGGGTVVFQPWPAEYEAVESGDYVADVSKAAALLGFEPSYDLATGLDEMFGDAQPAAPSVAAAAEYRQVV
jgi:UDP-glucose 4-epimerase